MPYKNPGKPSCWHAPNPFGTLYTTPRVQSFLTNELDILNGCMMENVLCFTHVVVSICTVFSVRNYCTWRVYVLSWLLPPSGTNMDFFNSLLVLHIPSLALYMNTWHVIRCVRCSSYLQRQPLCLHARTKIALFYTNQQVLFLPYQRGAIFM